MFDRWYLSLSSIVQTVRDCTGNHNIFLIYFPLRCFWPLNVYAFSVVQLITSSGQVVSHRKIDIGKIIFDLLYKLSNLVGIIFSHPLRYAYVRHLSVVSRVPGFPPGPGGPCSILGWITNFNFYPGTGCVSFVCFLSSVVSSGGPDIWPQISGRPALVYLSNVQVQSLCSPYLGWKSRGGGVSPTAGEGKERKKKKERKKERK